jgi:hypothetical protein
MRCCRKIVGKTKRDPVRSVRIREQVGQESVRRVLEERQLKCSELSSGLYCHVRLLSTDVSEVHTASIIRDE